MTSKLETRRTSLKPSTEHTSVIHLMSFNGRGSKIPEKRSLLLNQFRKLHIQFAFLQETHFQTGKVPRFIDKQFTLHFLATNPDTKSKGVLILIRTDIDLQLQDTLADPEGRFLFVKGSVKGRPITLANIYSLNSNPVSFFRRVALQLTSFASGMLLLAGDLNTPPHRHLQGILDDFIQSIETNEENTTLPALT